MGSKTAGWCGAGVLLPRVVALSAPPLARAARGFVVDGGWGAQPSSFVRQTMTTLSAPPDAKSSPSVEPRARAAASAPAWGAASAGAACVGDINRQYSQAARGGGTLCYAKKDVFAAFDALGTL